ncbi:MAG TPA: prepilin peptidase [Caulobacteraceae bacterium]|jgi:prepilin peptidase CpaA|nr:prepilin peptidase [Caulobacteraceae bacterium]
MTPDLIKTVVLCTFAALVIGAAVKDISSFTIPNWISIALAAAFIPAALALGVSLPVIGISFAVGIAALVLAAVMFALGWIGGGDAKLMAAAALWVGLRGIGPFAIYTGLAGGALALALVALRSAWLRPIAHAGPAWTRRLATPGESAPYGVAIAIGALAAFALHPLV